MSGKGSIDWLGNICSRNINRSIDVSFSQFRFFEVKIYCVVAMVVLYYFNLVN